MLPLDKDAAWSTIQFHAISGTTGAAILMLSSDMLFLSSSVLEPYSSKPMYTGGGDSRVIYAPGVVPSSSSYDAGATGGGTGSGAGAGGGGGDDAAAGGGYRVNAKPNPMGQHGSTGSAGGGVEGGDAAPGGGGMYHADGGAADEGGAI